MHDINRKNTLSADTDRFTGTVGRNTEFGDIVFQNGSYAPNQIVENALRHIRRDLRQGHIQKTIKFTQSHTTKFRSDGLKDSALSLCAGIVGSHITDTRIGQGLRTVQMVHAGTLDLILRGRGRINMRKLRIREIDIDTADSVDDIHKAEEIHACEIIDVDTKVDFDRLHQKICATVSVRRVQTVISTSGDGNITVAHQ